MSIEKPDFSSVDAFLAETAEFDAPLDGPRQSLDALLDELEGLCLTTNSITVPTAEVSDKTLKLKDRIKDNLRDLSFGKRNATNLLYLDNIWFRTPERSAKAQGKIAVVEQVLKAEGIWSPDEPELALATFYEEDDGTKRTVRTQFQCLGVGRVATGSDAPVVVIRKNMTMHNRDEADVLGTEVNVLALLADADKDALRGEKVPYKTIEKSKVYAHRRLDATE